MITPISTVAGATLYRKTQEKRVISKTIKPKQYPIKGIKDEGKGKFFDIYV